MIVKRLFGFPFGTKVTSRAPPQKEVAVIVRGRFTLHVGEPATSVGGPIEQEFMTADVFPEGDDERLGECLYASDFADFKAGTDILLRGSCFTPGSTPVPECTVRFGVGTWAKSLRVVGNRTWVERSEKWECSEPRPFVWMPLGYAHAFGGPAFPANPAGKGHESLELPNVEDPRHPIHSRRDQPLPAGFGPINPAWPQRALKIGKEYGESWRKTRHPFYAEDFDWSYFRAAPVDQQLPHYLRGDEPIIFENLHPTVPRISALLPGLRIRAFLRTSEPALVEPPMRLDTLFADMQAGTITLTWRGLAPVQEDDLKDVRSMLLASEPLADDPLEPAHYQRILEAFEADPLEKGKHLPPEAKAATPPPGAADAAKKDPAGAVGALMKQAAGQDPAMQAAGDRVVSDLRGGMAQLDAMKEQAANANAVAAPGGATAMAKRLEDALAQLEKMRDRMAADGAPPAKVAQVDELLANPKLAELSKAKPEVEPGPGRDLSGRDLAGRDLTGRDLSGANLQGAKLMGAQLAGANLAGANLREAILAGADLQRASLTGADLSKATVSEAKLQGALLVDAVLDGTLFSEADLSGARLDGARGARVMFAKCKLKGVVAQRVLLVQAIVLETDFTGADLRLAQLRGCSFYKIDARGILLENADVFGSGFMQSDLSDAQAAEMRGERSVWREATLDGADLRWSHLPWANFDEASLRRVQLTAAELKGASFYRAVLDDAVLTDSNLFSANLSKARMSRTSFARANLYSVRLLGAGGDDPDFEDANLKLAVRDPS